MPFGASSPATHSRSRRLPSVPRREMKPLPSFSFSCARDVRNVEDVAIRVVEGAFRRIEPGRGPDLLGRDRQGAGQEHGAAARGHRLYDHVFPPLRAVSRAAGQSTPAPRKAKPRGASLPRAQHLRRPRGERPQREGEAGEQAGERAAGDDGERARRARSGRSPPSRRSSPTSRRCRRRRSRRARPPRRSAPSAARSSRGCAARLAPRVFSTAASKTRRRSPAAAAPISTMKPVSSVAAARPAGGGADARRARSATRSIASRTPIAVMFG